MTVWLLAAALTGAALLLMIRAIADARATPQPNSSTDVRFYREQIAEIRRQAEAGLLADAEFQSAETEAARRLLAARAAEEKARPRSAPTSAQTLRTASLAMLVLVPAIAAGVYAWLGSPDLPAEPLAGRSIPDPALAEINALIEQMEGRLKQTPDDARGLTLMAPLYLRAGRPADAVTTLRHLIDVDGATPERQTDLGEALVAADQGRVPDEAKALFEAALGTKPDLSKAKFYLARAYAQDGDATKARAIYEGLLAAVPEKGPLHALITSEIERLKVGRASPSTGKTP